MANKIYYKKGNQYVDANGHAVMIVKGNQLTFTDYFDAGGGGELPVASASTLGGVKVGDGLNVASDGTLSILPIAYSSNEVETGETYNGEKVYTKEITLAEPTVISPNEYPTLIADATGYAQFVCCMALQQGGGCIPVNVFIETGVVKTHTYDAYTGLGYLIKYTKPTPAEPTNTRTVKKTVKKG